MFAPEFPWYINCPDRYRKPGVPVMIDPARPDSIVVLASSFYTAALEQPFVQALAKHGVARGVVCVPYNQLHTFLLDPRSIIPAETPAIVILLLRVEDLIRLESANSRPTDADVHLGIFRERTAQFLDVLSRVRGVCLTLLICPSGRGAHDVSFLGNAVRVAEFRSAAELRRQQGHKVVLWSDFERTVPHASMFNVAGDRLGHVPYSPDGLAALAEFFVKQIGSLPTTTLPATPKAEAKDGDNTALQQFLGTLGVGLSVSPLTAEDEAAAVDLIRHTTHFINTPDRKWAVGDVRALVADTLHGQAWVVRVSDRFGDYGVSGAMTFTFGAETMRVGFWFLTCPVLGKQVEYALLNWFAHIAELRRVTAIEVPFVKGRDNQVLFAFLSRMDDGAAKAVAELPLRAETTFRLAVSGLKELVIRNAPNPGATAEIISKIRTVDIDTRVSA